MPHLSAKLLRCFGRISPLPPVSGWMPLADLQRALCAPSESSAPGRAKATTTVCGGFEIGVDVDQLLEHGARYRDKRPVAKAMWQTIMDVLQEVGAIDERTLRRTAR